MILNAHDLETLDDIIYEFRKSLEPYQPVEFNLEGLEDRKYSVDYFLLLTSKCGNYRIFKCPGYHNFSVYASNNPCKPMFDATTLIGIGTTIQMAINICEGYALQKQMNSLRQLL